MQQGKPAVPRIRFYFIIDDGKSREKVWRTCKADADITLAAAAAICRYFDLEGASRCYLKPSLCEYRIFFSHKFIAWLNMDTANLSVSVAKRKEAAILALATVGTK